MSSSEATLGGKGAALNTLQDGGFRVPPFLILPATFLQARDSRGAASRGEIVARCRPLLQDWGAKLGPGPYAVRSSAGVEDSELHSFAGQFTTLLDVALKDLPEAITEVGLSAGTSAQYAAAAAVSAGGGIAVIIQRMVRATAAGVAFSAHPVHGTDVVVINAVHGLGDKLVDGSCNSDAYEVDETGLRNSSFSGDSPVLTSDQVLEVAALARRAQTLFGRPQDIEFAFDADKLYILQSRPITTIPPNATIWDNSNIVESYPGLTLPLTYTFIEKMYDAVYRQFTSVVGVTTAQIDSHSSAFANMLGLLNGRVYYNLNSWYEALALLPGYSLNAAFMERMMGVKEKPRITVTADRQSTIGAWWNVARGVRGILNNLRTAKRQATAFATAFHTVYEPFTAKNFEQSSLAEIWNDYVRFERLMLREWKAPLVNDFFAMIYFGLLQKQCARLAPDDPNLHNRLLGGSDAVLTTQPMRELPRIAAAIAEHPALLEVARNGTAAELLNALNAAEHSAAGSLYRAYIEMWGERSVAELKLETITYRQEPVRLARLLQSYLNAGPLERMDTQSCRRDRDAAQEFIAARLRGKRIASRVFMHILSQARYFVAQRENLRYYRTRGFGMVRRMMLAIGNRLAEIGIADDPRDVFWLELREIEALATGAARQPLHELIAGRKAEYSYFEDAPLPQRLQTYGRPKGLIGQTYAKPAAGGGNVLQGLPCAAGIVRARVRLVSYADELRGLDGAILATYATDPGFVVLFATASGIITERGSLLSHAAIVSREMGIPCIVGIDGLMDRLHDGDLIEMNGSTGIVTIIRE